MLTRSELRSLVERHGETDLDYLEFHYERYRETLERYLLNGGPTGGRLLDVGAHWLHQSVLWGDAGFEVSALDLPTTLERPSVRSLAAAHGIELYPEPDLERPSALRQVPADHFQVILFAEILEHLTFNPVAMWTELYRVLAPGGRIVITTPNYYALRSLVLKLLRFLRGRGGGLHVRSVLGQHTHAHHWKEYSAAEIRQYFGLLSADFKASQCQHVADYYPSESWWVRSARRIEAVVRWLRPNIHVEIALPAKQVGVRVTPEWAHSLTLPNSG